MKKLIAIILCVLMAFSAVNLTAFAQDEEPADVTQEETTDVTQEETNGLTPEEIMQIVEGLKELKDIVLIPIEDGEYTENLINALKVAGLATAYFPVYFLIGMSFGPGGLISLFFPLFSYINIVTSLLGYKSIGTYLNL